MEKFDPDQLKTWCGTNNSCNDILEFLQGHRHLIKCTSRLIKCTSRLYVTCLLDGLYMLRWQSSAPDRRYSPLSFHAMVFTWRYNKTVNIRFPCLLHSENVIHSQNTNRIIKTTKNIVQKLSLKVYAWSFLTSIFISTSLSNSRHSLEAAVFMWLLQSNLSLWTPPYYRQFFWSQKCQKSYIPYLLNTHNSVNWTLSWFCPVGVGIKEVWLYLIRKTISYVNSHVEFHYFSSLLGNFNFWSTKNKGKNCSVSLIMISIWKKPTQHNSFPKQTVFSRNSLLASPQFKVADAWHWAPIGHDHLGGSGGRLQNSRFFSQNQ